MAPDKLTDEQQAELNDAAHEAIVALTDLAQVIRRQGGREGVHAHFAAYHLADLEGEGAGWLGRDLLFDALHDLIEQPTEDDDEEHQLREADATGEYDSRGEGLGERSDAPAWHYHFGKDESIPGPDCDDCRPIAGERW